MRSKVSEVCGSRNAMAGDRAQGYKEKKKITSTYNSRSVRWSKKKKKKKGARGRGKAKDRLMGSKPSGKREGDASTR